MDYTNAPLLFKLRKVWRYARIYGPRLTTAKVRAQLHMKKKFQKLPASRTISAPHQTVGLIGCGNYSYSTISYYLNSRRGRVIAACMDRNINRAASMSSAYGIPAYSDDARVVLENPTIDLVYIASNHASHADYAIAALENGKNAYIEKPHVVSEEQLKALLTTMDRSPGRVMLGFNRPGSRFGQLILSNLKAQNGPGMYCWFVAGHAIDPDHWYFAPKEGGRVLGNLCHWTDFVLRMAPADQFPVEIRPTRGRKSDVDIVVTYTFPDETIAAISFSAKGHTFEGVKEKLNAHRGNCLLSMEDYKTLVIEIGETRTRYSSLFRDHGHEANIIGAFDSVRKKVPVDRAVMRRYTADTGWLFLKTREALEANRPLTVSACPF